MPSLAFVRCHSIDLWLLSFPLSNQLQGFEDKVPISLLLLLRFPICFQFSQFFYNMSGYGLFVYIFCQRYSSIVFLQVFHQFYIILGHYLLRYCLCHILSLLLELQVLFMFPCVSDVISLLRIHIGFFLTELCLLLFSILWSI